MNEHAIVVSRRESVKGARVFEPFKHLEKAASPRDEGAGRLWLPSSSRIASREWSGLPFFDVRFRKARDRLRKTHAVMSPGRDALSSSFPGLNRRSRFIGRGADLSGMAGTRPAMTKKA
jgi:hypothetical protein